MKGSRSIWRVMNVTYDVPITTFLPSKASVVVVSSAVDRHMIGHEGRVVTVLANVMVTRRPASKWLNHEWGWVDWSVTWQWRERTSARTWILRTTGSSTWQVQSYPDYLCMHAWHREFKTFGALGFVVHRTMNDKYSTWCKYPTIHFTVETARSTIVLGVYIVMRVLLVLCTPVQILRARSCATWY